MLRDEKIVEVGVEDEDGNPVLKKQRVAKNNAVLLFDETDRLWNSLPMINIMQLATHSAPGKKRIVKHDLKLTKQQLNEPSEVKVRMIFFTNKDLSDPTQFDKGLRVHIEAINSRENPQVIPNDREAIWEYSIYLTIREGMIRKLPVPPSLEETNDALAFFTENIWRFRELSPRTLVKIARERKRSPTMWKEMFESALDMNAPSKPIPPTPRIIV